MRAFTQRLRETLRARAGESRRRMRCSRNWLSATPRRIAAASPSRACAGCGCGRRERWSRTARQRVGGFTLRRLEERGQRPKGVTHPRPLSWRSAVPDPGSPSRPSPLARVARSRASLDRCARLRLLASMVLRGKPARRAGFAQQRPWMHSAASERRSHLKANAKRSSGRSGRSAAEQPRSGLTAAGRSGRRPTKMCARIRPAAAPTGAPGKRQGCRAFVERVGRGALQ